MRKLCPSGHLATARRAKRFFRRRNNTGGPAVATDLPPDLPQKIGATRRRTGPRHLMLGGHFYDSVASVREAGGPRRHERRGILPLEDSPLESRPQLFA